MTGSHNTHHPRDKAGGAKALYDTVFEYRYGMPKLLHRMGLDRGREGTNSAAAPTAGRRVANISRFSRA